MPICVQCGENEFDCIDGLFYCAICQTQSQDVRVEEEEDPLLATGEGRPVVLKAKGDKPPKEAKEIDKGRLWVTHEGFQYILLEQVKTLIKLGAREDLKEVVWRLWMMYLSKVGVAFTNTKEPPKDPLAYRSHPTHRDVNPGTLENPIVKSIRCKATRKGRQGLTGKKSTGMADLSEALETEEFYKGDNPLEEEEKSDDEEELLFHNEISEFAKAPAIGHVVPSRQASLTRRCYNDVARMNLPKTLALCYLGLLYTDSLTGPGDLTRWIKAGKLSFWTASSVLPEDMKFFSYDGKTFSSKAVPMTKRIRLDSARLANFLDIRSTLPIPDIQSLIHRHIHTLQLPGDLHRLAANLLKRRPPNITDGHNKSRKYLPDYDMVAMGYIIFILKVLLGLDDYTERQLSTFARKLMDMVTLKQPLFVWEDWFEYMEKVKAENEEFFILEKRENVREVRDVSAFTKPLEEFSAVRRRKTVRVATQTHEGMMSKVEVRESLEKCFSLLGGKWKERNPHKTVLASESESFDPSAAATLMDEDPIGFLVDSPQKKITASAKPKWTAAQDFRKASLMYITHQENFLEELDKQGLSDFTIYSSCLSSSGGESEEDNDSLADDLFTGQPRSSIDAARMPDAKGHRRKKRHRNRAKEAVRKAASAPTNSKTSQRISKEGLMENFARAYERYNLYSAKSSVYSRHRSYDWLVKLCSRTIDCEEEDLQNFVRKLQCVFMEDAKVGINKNSLNAFFGNYFS